jgi:hypothetical protein
MRRDVQKKREAARKTRRFFRAPEEKSITPERSPGDVRW